MNKKNKRYKLNYLSADFYNKYNSVDYPVGMLDDIRINFMHYESFEQAKEKWIERCNRIDKSNMFVIYTVVSAILLQFMVSEIPILSKFFKIKSIDIYLK